MVQSKMTAKQVGNDTNLGPRLPEKPNPICLEFQIEVSVCVELAFLLLQLFNKKLETLWSSSAKWSMKASVGRHPIYTSIRLRGIFQKFHSGKSQGIHRMGKYIACGTLEKQASALGGPNPCPNLNHNINKHIQKQSGPGQACRSRPMLQHAQFLRANAILPAHLLGTGTPKPLGGALNYICIRG